jgi:hypothetical protein
MQPPTKRPTRSRRLALAWFVLGLASLPGLARGVTPCAADVEKFCANVPIGGGRIQACLREHEKELSPECAARHENVAKEMGALAATCRDDISRFCSDVSPGQGRVALCLDRHRDDLSPACKDRLPKAGPVVAK